MARHAGSAATLEAPQEVRDIDVHFMLTLQGISALLMNANTTIGVDKGRDPAAWEREHYRDAAYTNTDGQLVIPARAIKKAAIEACKFYPAKPKGTAFKSFAPFIQAATIVAGDALLFIGVGPDARPATIDDLTPFTTIVNLDPSKGPRGPKGPRTRAMLAPPWRATAEVIVFDTILTEAHLAEIYERAGKQCGLLDGRTIDFGRGLISIKRM